MKRANAAEFLVSFFRDFRFLREYWQAISMLGTVIVFLAYLVFENRQSIAQVDEISSVNKELHDRVSRLEGEVYSLRNLTNLLMMQRDPENYEEQLEEIQRTLNQERREKIYYYNISPVAPSSPKSTNIVPSEPLPTTKLSPRDATADTSPIRRFNWPWKKISKKKD